MESRPDAPSTSCPLPCATVLKAFGEILKSSTRSSDISGRIGGEEFLHVITHADEAHLPMIADRTRA